MDNLGPTSGQLSAAFSNVSKDIDKLGTEISEYKSTIAKYQNSISQLIPQLDSTLGNDTYKLLNYYAIDINNSIPGIYIIKQKYNEKLLENSSIVKFNTQNKLPQAVFLDYTKPSYYIIYQMMKNNLCNMKFNYLLTKLISNYICNISILNYVFNDTDMKELFYQFAYNMSDFNMAFLPFTLNEDLEEKNITYETKMKIINHIVGDKFLYFPGINYKEDTKPQSNFDNLYFSEEGTKEFEKYINNIDIEDDFILDDENKQLYSVYKIKAYKPETYKPDSFLIETYITEHSVILGNEENRDNYIYTLDPEKRLFYSPFTFYILKSNIISDMFRIMINSIPSYENIFITNINNQRLYYNIDPKYPIGINSQINKLFTNMTKLGLYQNKLEQFAETAGLKGLSINVCTNIININDIYNSTIKLDNITQSCNISETTEYKVIDEKLKKEDLKK